MKSEILSMRVVTSCLAVLAVLMGACLPVRGAESNSEKILFTNAVIHTVTGEVLDPGQLLIHNGRIQAVGAEVKAGKIKKKDTVDLKRLHVYPGLIAATSTLGLTEINAVRATRDDVEVGSYTPDVLSWVAVTPDSELIPVARANGVTHFVPVPEGGTVPGISGVMATSGWTVEDLAVKREAALHLRWPGMALDTRPKEAFADKSKYKSLEDQAKERKEAVRKIDEFFNDAEAYAKAKRAARKAKQLESFQVVPAWEAMLPVLAGHMPIFIRAADARQIRSAVEWAEGRKYQCVIVGAQDAWRVADLLAEKKIPVIYECAFEAPPKDADSYDIQYKAPSILQAAGVKTIISMGPDSFQASNVRNLPYHAAQCAAYGLPVDEALKSITLYPAQVLGLENRLGSIAPGKDATFFAVDGDILDIRSQVKRMWMNGNEVSLESRHTRLYEKYKARPLPKE